MIILNLSESLAKPLVMAKLNIFLKFEKPSQTAVVPIAGVKSRILRAPGTSSDHLVPKHLRATWPRPEQSHLLPEACSPNGTDSRQQRQRRTKRPPPEPSNILKKFHALRSSEKTLDFDRNWKKPWSLMGYTKYRNFHRVPNLQIFAPGAAL